MNITESIERVSRELGCQERMTAVIVSGEFDASVDEIWNACTNPDNLKRWFEPVVGDLREGGRYQLEGSGSSGVIERCERPNRLDVTWEYEGEISRVEMTISKQNGKCLVRLAHLLHEDDHWREYGPAATGVGWESSFLSLRLHLAGDPRAEPSEMEKFAATPEGIDFVRQTAERWGEVHARSGADRQHAKAAALKTIAAYTGVDSQG